MNARLNEAQSESPAGALSKQPRVYIVILNWNGWRDTIECLESVLRHSYANQQIVVCDNDSQNQSVEHILNWAAGSQPCEVKPVHPLARLSQPPLPKPIHTLLLDRDQAEAPRSQPVQGPLVLIRTGGNLGFAGGNNVGLRYVLQQGDADYVWLLNNDTVVEPRALQAMVEHTEALARKGQASTCGSLVCFYDDPNIVQALGGSRFNPWTGVASQTLGRFASRNDAFNHQEVAASLSYITGCSWLLPIGYLTEVGLMEEGYFLYYEEIDWTVRAEGRYALTYAPEGVIYHKEGSSIGSKTIRRAPSQLSEHYMTRSKLRFTLRFYPWAWPLAFLLTLGQALNRVRQGHAKNALTILKAALGKSRFP